LASLASPGCPVPAPFGRAVRRFRELPRFPVLWLYRRWIFELPRISHPQAPRVSVIPRVAPFPHALLRCPLTRNLGCPAFRISGLAGDGVSSCPESRILRRCRVTGLQVAPNFGLSVSPMILLRVAPHPDLPAPADGPPEFPLGCAPSGCASGLKLRVSPNLRSHRSSQLSKLPGCPGSLLLWLR